MAKKKTKKKTKTPSIVKRFDKYFGSGTLEDWQRLCRDVGLEGSYGSITQCRKVYIDTYLPTYRLNYYTYLLAK